MNKLSLVLIHILVLFLFHELFHDISGIIVVGEENFDIIREKFDKKFHQKCGKYPFVEQYKRYLSNLSQVPKQDLKYIIFTFHEGKASLGGLGDRLAGLITTIAYAIRYNRVLLIAADNSFEEYFQSYFHYSQGSMLLSWKDWTWSGLSIQGGDFSNYTIKHLHCINPKSSQKICSLENLQFEETIIKIRVNRAYLCRWYVYQDQLKIKSQLLSLFHSEEGSSMDNDQDDLLEISGCLLRLVMWPTTQLWKDLYTHYFANHVDNKILYQIGFHFRCGDDSFAKVNSKSSQCFIESKETWKGTSFYDDISLDSPVDAGACGRRVINEITSLIPPDSIFAYIASDNIVSSQQINETLTWTHTIQPSKACHVDFQSPIASKCLSNTLLQWFMLSISDMIIMQSLVIADLTSTYHDEQKFSSTGELIPPEQGPISAFSRYAAIYGLSSHESRYGITCNQTNSIKLARQTLGNWVCDPKLFF